MWDLGNESCLLIKIVGFFLFFFGMVDGLIDIVFYVARSICVVFKCMDFFCFDSFLFVECSMLFESKYCIVFVKGYILFLLIEIKARTVRICCTNKYVIYESVFVCRILLLLMSILNICLLMFLFL